MERIFNMWQMLALSLTVIGGAVVYLTNKNQRFTNKSLSKRWRIVGYCCWFLSLVSWLQILVISAALFTWFFTLSTVLICVPLLSLMTKPNKNKSAIKGAQRE